MIVFMQEGVHALPLWGLPVRRSLYENLANCWINRGSSNMTWPPRSPDLSPCDFFLWGFIKSKVYKENSATIKSLKGKIIAAVQEHITEEMCSQSCYNGIPTFILVSQKLKVYRKKMTLTREF